MILAGDEFGRTQGGNNNGYAQDSEISWVNWDLSDNAKALQGFVRRLIALRHAQPLFERANWRDMMSVTWLNAGGGEQQAAHWEDGGATTIAVRFARDDLKESGWHLVGSDRRIQSARCAGALHGAGPRRRGPMDRTGRHNKS